MTAFGDEINRLKNLLHRGYLQRDPKEPAIRGVTFKPALMNYDVAVIMKEIEQLQTLGINTVRIDWYAAGDLDSYLQVMSEHGIKTIVLTPYPAEPNLPSYYHYDPFDKFTVENWKTTLTPFLQKYANDKRIYALEIIGEPKIKPEHYQQMIELGQWVKQNCIQEVTIGLNIPELVQPLAPAVSVISFHAYAMSLLQSNQDIITITGMFRQYLQTWKTFGKPILIGEIGFPTWNRAPSNTGNSPYIINDPILSTTSTSETEILQYDYLANMLHVIKDENLLGYLIYQWTDDLPGGEGGFGLKTKYPELKAKKSLELLGSPALSPLLFLLGILGLVGIVYLVRGGETA